MLLTVDIGNTTVTLGWFRGGQLTGRCQTPHSGRWERVGWGQSLTCALAGCSGVEGVVLASVVPALTRPVAQAAARCTGAPVQVVDPAQAGLPLGEYDPHTLGVDRVADCVGALGRYAPPLAVFDLGTATTLSVVDGAGVFRGGMILPGLALSLEALTRRGAQLPAVTLGPPQGLVGLDTHSCLRNGVLYGAAGAIEGIVARLERELGGVTVVLTGGNSAHVCHLLDIPAHWEPDLTLQGLRLLWRAPAAVR